MTSDMFRLDGKVAVVTGGSRGIGKMIAAGLLGAGAQVFLSSRKEADLQDTARELSHLGDVHIVAADLGTSDGVAALATQVADRADGVQALFNNAGANWGALFESFPESAWDKVLAVNVKVPFMMTQAFLPLLKQASTPTTPPA